MGAVTYPNPDVERFIEENFIPVQFNVVEQPDVMAQFNSSWTPTLILRDPEGREHRRAEGYFDPKRFIAEMSIGLLKAAINWQNFDAAKQRAPAVLEATKGDREREPEAIYWASVADYKGSHDPANLLRGWNRILDEFPASDWARRVEFIRQ